MRSTNPARGIPGETAAEGSYCVNPLPLHDLARLTREMGSFVGEWGEKAKERDREATKHKELLREREGAVFRLPEVGEACDANPPRLYRRANQIQQRRLGILYDGGTWRAKSWRSSDFVTRASKSARRYRNTTGNPCQHKADYDPLINLPHAINPTTLQLICRHWQIFKYVVSASVVEVPEHHR